MMGFLKVCGLFRILIGEDRVESLSALNVNHISPNLSADNQQFSMSPRPSFIVARTRNQPLLKRFYSIPAGSRPAQLSKPIIDLKHIRENPGLYETNCLQRNYPHLARNSWQVLELTEKWESAFPRPYNMLDLEGSSSSKRLVRKQARPTLELQLHGVA